MDTITDKTTPAATLPGAMLAAAREAQGLSVEDISQRLKLSVAQIKSIEADDHSKLPTPVYVRGFIRSYARLLKLDSAQLLPPKVPAPPVVAVPTVREARDTRDTRATPDTRGASVIVETPPVPHTHNVSSISTTAGSRSDIPAEVLLMRDAPREAIEPSPYRRVPALLGVIAVVILGLAYYEFVFNAPPVPVDTPVSVSGNTNTHTQPVAITPVLEQPKATAPAEVPADALTLKKSTDPASGAANGLHFVFNGESWVEVRDGDGKIVFSNTNQAGTEQRVTGMPPLSVVVGGSSRVRLSFNGKAIDLASYANDDVARLRLE